MNKIESGDRKRACLLHLNYVLSHAVSGFSELPLYPTAGEESERVHSIRSIL
jgi:hypothetical protein